MKMGDLVYVPANVTLVRNVPHFGGLLGIRHYKTKVPKKAMFIEHSSTQGLCHIEYGEYTWVVDSQDIEILEQNNDC